MSLFEDLKEPNSLSNDVQMELIIQPEGSADDAFELMANHLYNSFETEVENSKDKKAV